MFLFIVFCVYLWLVRQFSVSRRAAKDRQISRVTLYTSLQTFELHLGALILSLNEDYLGRDTHTTYVLQHRASEGCA